MKAYRFKINGREYNVAVQGIEGGKAKVNVNGVDYEVELEENAAPGAPAEVPVQTSAPVESAPAARTEPEAAGGAVVTSPLPGVIVEVSVKEGQAVKRGQKVAVIEAMKMENDILASVDGTVKSVVVNKGDSVLEGDKILSIG